MRCVVCFGVLLLALVAAAAAAASSSDKNIASSEEKSLKNILRNYVSRLEESEVSTPIACFGRKCNVKDDKSIRGKHVCGLKLNKKSISIQNLYIY